MSMIAHWVLSIVGSSSHPSVSRKCMDSKGHPIESPFTGICLNCPFQPSVHKGHVNSEGPPMYSTGVSSSCAFHTKVLRGSTSMDSKGHPTLKASVLAVCLNHQSTRNEWAVYVSNVLWSPLEGPLSLLYILLSHPSVHNRYKWTVRGVQCNMSSKRFSCSCSSFISQSPRWTVRYIPWSPQSQASVASVCPFKKCMDSEGHPMESSITGLCCICLSLQEMYGQWGTSHGVPSTGHFSSCTIPWCPTLQASL